MIHSLKCNLDDVVLWIIGNTEQRQPFRLDLVAELERGDLYLGTFTDKRFRHPIEVSAPLRFFELLRHWSRPPSRSCKLILLRPLAAWASTLNSTRGMNSCFEAP